MPVLIGKVVNASSHVDYVCRVYGRGETDALPQPHDYGFGTFVAVRLAEGGYLVGVIHNTSLWNPEFGNLGPRLSPVDALAVFSPDYLEERATLVAIVILGAVDSAGQVRQGVPVEAASIDAQVHTLAVEEVVAFHQGGEGIRLGYLPMLAARGEPLSPYLLLHLVAYLSQLFPQQAQRLKVLERNLAWRSRVDPVR
ncbi:MAG: hypothetical protein A2Y73_06935 [Chloroflexi bacterium RBG_13_56_8]|nr:MAG: hypothetical protein A2Y73_06935 [Chloroflexi bacterium RBG_13_56_8]